ncbi:MAG: hypothetical protein ACT4P4_13755 [Betaproteobacteria bacterium]
MAQSELGYLERRAGLIYTAIALAVFCALLIFLLIALAFIDAFLPFEIFLGVNTERCPVI